MKAVSRVTGRAGGLSSVQGGTPTIRAVLFDAVGTLIRPYPSVGSVYSRAAAPFGVRCRPSILDRHFRKAYHELMPERFTGSGLLRTSETRERRWWKRAVVRTFERAGCGTPPAAATEAAFEAFSRAASWRLYADAGRVLARLARDGIILGVVSNYDLRLRRVFREMQLDRYFTVVTLSTVCGRAKPSPLIFRAALRALAVRPGEALFVGDRREEDYLAPRRAGLDALWLVREGRRRGGEVIRSLDRVPRRLGYRR